MTNGWATPSLLVKEALYVKRDRHVTQIAALMDEKLHTVTQIVR